MQFHENIDCNYQYDYIDVHKQLIESTSQEQVAILRDIIENDLFFIVYFILKIEVANHPFIVDRCKEVQNGPITNTLDVWPRYHFKSTIITIAETIQFHLKYPEKCTCIFSYKKAAAEKFVSSIRRAFESDFLINLFPDKLYANPGRESGSWSLVNGITIKRSNKSRPQRTVQASGLVEGMLQGDHFERRLYDDIETDDMKDSREQMDKCYDKFCMSVNLGTGLDDDIERVVGTFYSHLGPLVRIKDHKTIYGDDAYSYRKYAATDDGTVDGVPVLISQNKLDQLKTLPTFFSQQLCDPTPIHDLTLDPSLLLYISANDIPINIFKFMVIDPSGGIVTKRSDSWGIHIIGVEPIMDDIGASNIYILDSFIDKANESEIVYILSSMYRRNGIIEQVAYESVNKVTPGWIVHFQNAMKSHGISLSEETKNIRIITPQGREKKNRITSALRLPLLHGKLYISNNVTIKYVDALKNEMSRHPLGNDDGIDALSFIYNILDDFGFQWRIPTTSTKNIIPIIPQMHNEGWMGI